MGIALKDSKTTLFSQSGEVWGWIFDLKNKHCSLNKEKRQKWLTAIAEIQESIRTQSWVPVTLLQRLHGGLNHLAALIWPGPAHLRGLAPVLIKITLFCFIDSFEGFGA